MPVPKTIAIDAMGGDHGVAVTVPASLSSLAKHPELHLVLVGDEEKINTYIDEGSKHVLSRLRVLHTESAIDDKQQPGTGFRHNKSTSMFLAVEQVKEMRADACVSGGSTGALLLIGRHLLKMIPGIERPAIVACLSAGDESVVVLDVGANIQCDANHLFQFAIMGSILASEVELKSEPRVSLLNIGVEDYKGTEQIKLAATRLSTCDHLNYGGYIEGSELFTGKSDVVVCDGFTGNVTIKTSEGVVDTVLKLLHQQLNKNWINRIMGKLLAPLLISFRSSINPKKFNGATFLGLQGTIVKSHGNTDIEGFCHAIDQAINEVGNDIPKLISKKIALLVPSAKQSD